MSQVLWKAENDLAYYEKIREKKSVKYSVFPAYFNAALHNPGYRLILNDIEQMTKESSKWILLQEINVNSGGFSSYFIELSKPVEQVMRLKHGYLGNNKIQEKSAMQTSEQEILANLVFKQISDGLVDIPKGFVSDGTVYYITAMDNSTLRRMAIYHLEERNGNRDLVEVINIIKKSVI